MTLGKAIIAIAVSIAGLSAMAADVSAAEKKNPSPESVYFARADSDGDGKLSLPEFQDWMSYAFKRMDANHDDVLDPHEQGLPNARRLTGDEHRARLAEQFKRQDKNHDGGLSQREFLAPPG